MDRLGCGSPIAGDRVVHVGGDHEHVSLDRVGEQSGGEVLVDDRLHPANATVRVTHNGYAAATGSDHDVSGGDEGEDSPGLQNLQRGGRGDHPTPALLPSALPHLSVLHQLLGLGLRPEAADRLRRVGEARVVLVDPGAGDDGRDHADMTAPGEAPLQGIDDREADRGLGLGTAPVQGHGRDHRRSKLVLDQKVADLGTVPVGDDHLMTGRDETGHGLHRGGDRILLRRWGRAAVGRAHGIAAKREENPHEIPPLSLLSSNRFVQLRRVPGSSSRSCAASSGQRLSYPVDFGRGRTSGQLGVARAAVEERFLARTL